MNAAILAVFLAALPAVEMRSLVEQLGSAQFEERKAATQALWEMGMEALPLLEAAADSDDPEVAARATEIMLRIKRGEIPGLSADQQNILARFYEGDAETAADLMALNLQDPVLAPTLFGVVARREWAVGERQTFIDKLEARLLTQGFNMDSVESGRRIARLFLTAVRMGLVELNQPAADACWLMGVVPEDTDLNDHPGAAALRARFAFHAGRYAECAVAAGLPDPALRAYAGLLAGDWSGLKHTRFWQGGLARREGEIGVRLAWARLTAQQEIMEEETHRLLTGAAGGPPGTPMQRRSDPLPAGPLFHLLLNDAYDALPAYFSQTDDPLAEAVCTYELYHPTPLARVARRAWERAPAGRWFLVETVPALTGYAPTPHWGEMESLRSQMHERPPPRHELESEFPGRPDQTPPLLDPASAPALRRNAEQTLATRPRDVNALLGLGDIAHHQGLRQEAELLRLRAGWAAILLRGDVTGPGEECGSNLMDSPYREAAMDMLFHLCQGQESGRPATHCAWMAYLRGGDPAAALARVELGRLLHLRKKAARSYSIRECMDVSRVLAELRLARAFRHGDEAEVIHCLERGLDLLLHDASGVRHRLLSAGMPDAAERFAGAAVVRMHERLAPHPEAEIKRMETACFSLFSGARPDLGLSLLDSETSTGRFLTAPAMHVQIELLLKLDRQDEALAVAERGVRLYPQEAGLASTLKRLRRPRAPSATP